MPKKSEEKKSKTAPKAARERKRSAPKATPGAEAEEKQRASVRRQTERYFDGVGRRKTAVARVKLFTRGERTVSVNGRTFDAYFPTEGLRALARAALARMNVEDKFRVAVAVRGGGPSAQAEAMRHATARALLKFNPEFRKRLKRAGYLTRDPRMVERKKPGLKKARRAPQWSKR